MPWLWYVVIISPAFLTSGLLLCNGLVVSHSGARNAGVMSLISSDPAREFLNQRLRLVHLLVWCVEV